MGKATNFKCCSRIQHRLQKSPSKTFGKVTVGILTDSRKFWGDPYTGCIVRSSLR